MQSLKLTRQYDLGTKLLAKAVYGCSSLTVYVRVQWVVSWKTTGFFTPHFSITALCWVNNFWLTAPWGHDPSTATVLADRDRGPMCGVGLNQNDTIKLTVGYPSVLGNSEWINIPFLSSETFGRLAEIINIHNTANMLISRCFKLKAACRF